MLPTGGVPGDSNEGRSKGRLSCRFVLGKLSGEKSEIHRFAAVAATSRALFPRAICDVIRASFSFVSA